MKLIIMVVEDDFKEELKHKLETNRLDTMELDCQNELLHHKTIFLLSIQDYQLCLAKTLIKDYMSDVCLKNEDIKEADLLNLNDLIENKVSILITYEDISIK